MQAFELVMTVHLFYVIFVASGYVLVPLGAWRGWRWVRHRWYRRLHLAAIALVAGEALAGVVCPLTELEAYLRPDGGGGTFMGRLVESLLYSHYPAWVYTVAYVVCSLLALAMYRWIPPERSPAD